MVQALHAPSLAAAWVEAACAGPPLLLGQLQWDVLLNLLAYESSQGLKRVLYSNEYISG